mmetsp:Transcript_49646/g.118202  ORF Transcript_49646/g.118202 Transcript_49646/m.118202 type:complete len:802 (-) Transcript_49646:37-2442(-)
MPVGIHEVPTVTADGVKTRYPLLCTDDIYEAVVKAAFGGYKVFGISDTSRALHPAPLWLCASGLFLIQVYLIFALTVNSFSAEQRIDVESEGDIFLRIGQIMCILLVQLTVFKELEQGLHMLLFIANPFTWTWVKPVEHQGRKEAIWNPKLLYFLSTTSLCFKVFIALLTSASCSSVILECDSMENVIFNGLANLFLLDVDEHMLKFIYSIFSVEERGEGFSFELNDPATMDRIFAEGEIGQLGRRLWDHRGFVWRACRTLQFFIIFAFYTRQLFIVAIAFDTDTLPSARDVCAIRRQSKAIGLPIEGFTDELNSSIRKFCKENGSGRMGPSEALSILVKYPIPLMSLLFSLFMILMVPQILRVLYDDFDAADTPDTLPRHSSSWSNVSNGPTAQAQRFSQLEGQIVEVEHDIEGLRQEIENELMSLKTEFMTAVGKDANEREQLLKPIVHPIIQSVVEGLLAAHLDDVLRGYVTQTQLKEEVKQQVSEAAEHEEETVIETIQTRSVVHTRSSGKGKGKANPSGSAELGTSVEQQAEALTEAPQGEPAGRQSPRDVSDGRLPSRGAKPRLIAIEYDGGSPPPPQRGNSSNLAAASSGPTSIPGLIPPAPKKDLQVAATSSRGSGGAPPSSRPSPQSKSGPAGSLPARGRSPDATRGVDAGKLALAVPSGTQNGHDSGRPYPRIPPPPLQGTAQSKSYQQRYPPTSSMSSTGQGVAPMQCAMAVSHQQQQLVFRGTSDPGIAAKAGSPFRPAFSSAPSARALAASDMSMPLVSAPFFNSAAPTNWLPSAMARQQQQQESQTR